MTQNEKSQGCCGHPLAAIFHTSEGTHYCAVCESRSSPSILWGIDHCPLCEKPLPTNADRNNCEPGEGEHLCWDWPASHRCIDDTIEKRLIDVLHQRNGINQLSATKSKSLEEIS